MIRRNHRALLRERAGRSGFNAATRSFTSRRRSLRRDALRFAASCAYCRLASEVMMRVLYEQL